MIKRILKWTTVSLLSFVMILYVVVLLRQNRKFEAPYPDIVASKDTGIIARGRHLVMGPSHCVSCHGAPHSEDLLEKGEDIALTGGKEFKLPLGNFYVKNITPDSSTGIGRFTDREIARALRYSVRPDGTAIPEFMSFHNLTDEDLRAIISYLRVQKPVVHKVPEQEPNILGKVALAFIVKPKGPTGEVMRSITPDTTIAYGRYMARYAINCAECHTKRNSTGDFTGAPFAGGSPVKVKDLPPLTPPNISGDEESRLAYWTEQDFINRFRKGRYIAYSHMPWESFKRMSDAELKAIYRYLKTIKSH